MTNQPEIKPCPLCSAILFLDKDDCPQYYFECDNRHCFNIYDEEGLDSAVAAMNARAEPAPMSDKKLREALEEINGERSGPNGPVTDWEGKEIISAKTIATIETALSELQARRDADKKCDGEV